MKWKARHLHKISTDLKIPHIQSTLEGIIEYIYPRNCIALTRKYAGSNLGLRNSGLSLTQPSYGHSRSPFGGGPSGPRKSRN